MAHLHLNYIGSKKTLFDTLDKVFKKYVTKDTVFGDLFAGTGTVSYLIQERYHCPVITNDLQYYAYVLNRAILTRYTNKEKQLVMQKIAEYNQLPGCNGFMSRHYAPPKRMYFTRANARRIDAMRIRLEQERPHLPEKVYFYLLASIVVAADKVANTSSVYAAYLKEYKPSAQKPIQLPEPEFPDGVPVNRWYNGDALEVVQKFECDVLYLDPPYNTRQYADYYHILETVARYDAPRIHGKTGIRDELQRSSFSSAAEVENAFRALIGKVRSKVLIMSYNDEGILPHDVLRKILRTHGRVKLYKIPYKKFKAQQDVTRDELYEYLFVSIRE